MGVALSAFASGIVLHSTGGAAEATVTAQHVALPSYFWPGANWDAVIARAGAVDLAVVNVDSGPGTAAEPTFATTVSAAQARGIRVVGYVHTGYGGRPLADVLSDVDRYYAWYGVNGVFIDEVPYGCDQAAYYSAIATRVHSHPASAVIINPGANPEECAASYGDIIVNFEGTAATYQSWSPAPWTSGYPSERFWHLIYAANSTNVDALVALSRTRNAGHVYVTDDAMPNPWDRIPGAQVWAALTDAMNVRSGAPSAPGVSGRGEWRRRVPRLRRPLQPESRAPRLNRRTSRAPP